MADLIDKKSTLQDLRALPVDLDAKTVQRCIEVVSNEKSVQSVRHGHWIPKFGGEFKGGAYWYDCSECGHTVAGGILSGNNFCKNCGADMRGKHDGSD